MISLKVYDELIPYEKLTFSGGEVQVRLDLSALWTWLREDDQVWIDADIRSSEDVMTLLLVTDALRRNNVKKIVLNMPYLPYARQDRVCALGEALSLRVFCDLINAQRYDQVIVWDCHSDVGVALLDRSHHVPVESLIVQMPFITVGNPILVAPDAGSIKKVAACAKALKTDYVRADKTRDAKTGEITGTVVYSEHIGSRSFLIVDDICDGGRTFIELAKQLRPLTTGRVNLYVTHGIFSNGMQALSDIDNIYVANSFVKRADPSFYAMRMPT